MAATAKAPRRRERYGLQWDLETSPLDIELAMFLNQEAYAVQFPKLRLLGKEYHFKHIVEWYWGPQHKKHFVWNPWNERMLKAACANKWLWLSGAAASGKTDFMAAWGLVNWLAAPDKTLVLFTSTSLKEARMRVWGRVEEYFMNAGLFKNQWGKVDSQLPGKLVSSVGKIVTVIDGKTYPDHFGLHLIPGERAKEKENIGKLIGMHNERVLFLADEMPELSPALVEAGKANLEVNPYFQMIGSGNFKSIYDPFGREVEPKEGWLSITLESEEWECHNGRCLRFDGLKSPNVLLGYSRYPGIYGPDNLANHRKHGEHTLNFWRMCRSFVCQTSDADRIFSEADLLRGKVHETVKWREAPVPGAALDPAFATGGDRAMACFGQLGWSTENKHTLQVSEMVELREDVRLQDQSRSFQVAAAFRDECIRRGVLPENAAYDGSGGGLPFGALLSELWSPLLLGVQFGGGASERAASAKDKRPANKVYSNRVSELWYSGLDFVLSGQIRGIDAETAKELQERRYETSKGSAGLRIKVERKDQMKQRTDGVSPDRADCFVILLEWARTKHGFGATGMEGKRAKQESSWTAWARRVNDAVSTDTATYEEANESQEAVDA